MIVLSIDNLTKKFGKYTALDNVTFSLESGKIYGFVGNNGAGKTTLMRIVAGLSRQTAGKISLFSSSSDKELSSARRRMGTLIESPIFYPDMTARQNLVIQSKLQGETDNKRIGELLSMVGLYGGGVAKKSLRNYSNGMKQRYGLAFALLGDPELLMLDEPLNGLDIEGMDDISGILRTLCSEGKTILLSSHLLARLHSIATDYIFIDYGKIIKMVTSAEVNRKIQASDIEKYFKDLVRHEDALKADTVNDK
jgi:ABC-2 type transport system ATP-binding protein